MADLNIGIRVDTSELAALSAASQAVAADVTSLAERFMRQGLSAEEAAAALKNLGYSSEEIASALAITAGASTVASAAMGGFAQSEERAVSAMGAARVEMGVLSGSTGMLESGLARVAAQSQALGPVIQAAFVPFAVLALVDVLKQVFESFSKATDQVMGFTEALKRAEEADVKFSNEALGHAATMEEAHAKLGTILRQIGDIANESFSEKWARAAKSAFDETSSLYDPIAGLVIAYKALSTAESGATDEAVRLGDAQRSLLAVEAQKTTDLDREAVKLIDAKVSAQNAELTGAAGRVASIQNEINALHQKQSVEEEIAAHQAGLKAMREGGNAATAEREAKSNVDEEFYYKRIELTAQLASAEREYAEQKQTEAYRVIDAFRSIADAQKKYVEDSQKDATDVQVFWARAHEKMTSEALTSILKETKEGEKYVEEYNKITEERSLREISAEQATVAGTAELQKAKLASKNTSELERIEITKSINDQELAALEKLENDKLAAQLNGLEAQKNLVLGGQTEEEFKAVNQPGTANIGNVEELNKLQSANAAIEAAQQAHTAKMAELARRQAQDAENSANQMTQAYMRAFAPIDSEFNRFMGHVLQGNMTIALAFQQMGQQIVRSTIESLAQALLHHVEHAISVKIVDMTIAQAGTATTVASQVAQTAAVSTGVAARGVLEGTQTATHATGQIAQVGATVASQAGQTAAATTGASSRATVGMLADLKSIGSAAATAAAHAFKWVMEEVPFPVNAALAPAAAAAAFTGVMAFKVLASAQEGAVVPQDMPIYAHAGEMVLPTNLSSGFQNIIHSQTQNTTEGGGGDTHFHVSALDSKSVEDFMHGKQREISRAIKKAARDGRLGRRA